MKEVYDLFILSYQKDLSRVKIIWFNDSCAIKLLCIEKHKFFM